LPTATPGISVALSKVSVFVFGFLIFLNFLGLSIIPLITTFGIVSLALALTLQDTLANLFAGINVLLENSILGGDFVHLEMGHECYIENISC